MQRAVAFPQAAPAASYDAAMPRSAARLAEAVPATAVTAASPPSNVGPADLRVSGVADDTRRVRPGDLFIARGQNPSAALDRLAQACAAGASAAILPANTDEAAARQAAGQSVALFRAEPGTPLDQAAAGRVADVFFDRPGDELTLVGVTGTNGKTTVATLAAHLLCAVGVRTGLLGTVAVDTGVGPRPASLTTPGAVELRSLFAEMRDHGCRVAVMEVSSHALDQGRVAGLLFDVAVFTNLTQDHLDYHQTMEAYAAAKAKLFEGLAATGVGIGNGEDPAWPRLHAGLAPERRIDTRVIDGRAGRGAPGASSAAQDRSDAALATARVLDLGATSARAAFAGPFGSFEATLGTGGLHNVSNALQALAAANAVLSRSPPPGPPKGEITTGVDSGVFWPAALEAAPPVAGRLEPVPVPEGVDPNTLPAVLVDYAHTPDALERVLAALRPVTRGQLVCVYGCGGDRDRSKRPRMTRAALAGADLAVLTSDNPRTENPVQILDDASAGAEPGEAPRLRREIDRRRAIASAIALAGPGDTVLIAGKGHEDYQLVSDGAGGIRRLSFDDRQEAAAALASGPR